MECFGDGGSGLNDERYEDLTPEEWQAQHERLERELREHPGQVARRRWDELGRVQMIWVRNTDELLALLQALHVDEELKVELIQNVRPPLGREEIMGQLDQKLHNMLAAATSLVDHTRRHMDKYSESEFAVEFESRNKTVAEAPSSTFLRRLRNYLLHVGNAPFNLHAQFPTDHTDFDTIQLDIRLDPASLLKWDGWNSSSTSYIDSFPEGVPLPETVHEYATAMGGLYEWVARQFEVLHRQDIAGANDLVRRINLTLSAGAWDGRDREKRMTLMEENLRRHDRGEPQIDVRTGEEIVDD